jgi:hypothetical protein
VTNPQVYVATMKGVTAYSLYVCVDQGVVLSNSTLDKLLFFISMAQINEVNIIGNEHTIKTTGYLQLCTENFF